MRHGSTSYRVYDTWLERIDECKAAGLLPSRGRFELFQLIWAAVHGLISLRIHHPGFPRPPLDRHVNALLSLLDRGLRGAPPVDTRTSVPAARTRRPRRRIGRNR